MAAAPSVARPSSFEAPLATNAPPAREWSRRGQGLPREPPSTTQAFDRDFLEFAARSNQGEPGTGAEYRYDYLLVVTRKRGA